MKVIHLMKILTHAPRHRHTVRLFALEKHVVAIDGFYFSAYFSGQDFPIFERNDTDRIGRAPHLHRHFDTSVPRVRRHVEFENFASSPGLQSHGNFIRIRFAVPHSTRIRNHAVVRSPHRPAFDTYAGDDAGIG